MAWKALNFLACLLKRLYIVKMQRLEWNISYIKKKKDCIKEVDSVFP